MGKKIKFYGVLFIVGFLMLPFNNTKTINNEPVIVLAEEDSIIKSEEDKNIIEDWKEWKETYIDPLLAGGFITTIVTALVNIIMAYFNHKNNKKSNEEVRKSKEDNKALILAITEFMKNMGDILFKIEEGSRISQSIKEEFALASKNLLEKISKLTEETEKLQGLKPIIATLATIESKIAQCSKEVIQSGVGEDIALLAEQLKAL